MHLVNHRLLLQSFRPRFTGPYCITAIPVVVVFIVAVAIVIGIVVVVPLLAPVLGEANRIVSVIIVITSTGGTIRWGGASSTGVVMLVLLRWELVTLVLARCGTGNVPCAVGPPFPLVLVADN